MLDVIPDDFCHLTSPENGINNFFASLTERTTTINGNTIFLVGGACRINFQALGITCKCHILFNNLVLGVGLSYYCCWPMLLF